LPTSSSGQSNLEYEDDGTWSHQPHAISSTCEVKLFHIRYHTNRFNQYFYRLAMAAPKFWDIWFNLGVVFGGIAMIVGIITMFYAATQLLFSVGSILSRAQPAVHTGNLRKRDDTTFFQQKPAEDQVLLPMVGHCHFLLLLAVLIIH
jgi:hypothetical protein